MNQKLLGIYLNDHLAGATASVELIKRTAKSNKDNAFSHKLEELSREIQADKEALESVMDELGIPEDVLKKQVASLAEKVGRLKLNGQWTGYSPLSRVVELEGLKVAVTGKLSLWKSLEHLAEHLPIEGSQFAPLIQRAEDQLASIEGLRVQAVSIAMDSPEETTSR